MPFSSDKKFYQSPSTVVDSTPDGDSVREGFDNRLSPAMEIVYQDLNLLLKTGTAGMPDGDSIVVDENGLWSVPGVVFGGCIFSFSGTFGGSDGKRPIPRGKTVANELWALCDGTNGTPDLRNRFVIGASDTCKSGESGGGTTHTHGLSGNVGYTTLDTNTLPSHSHGVRYDGWDPVDAGEGPGTDWIGSGRGQWVHNAITYSGASWGHTHSLPVSSAASSAGLPPYYALAFIMKL